MDFFAYYKVLELNKNATESDIKSIQEAGKETHPDLNRKWNGKEIFQKE